MTKNTVITGRGVVTVEQRHRSTFVPATKINDIMLTFKLQIFFIYC